MRHRIAPGDVTVGMYVCGFGGSWFDHPYWFPRFVVAQKDLPRIAAADVPFVLIDDERGTSPAKADPHPMLLPAAPMARGGQRPAIRRVTTRSSSPAGQEGERDRAKKLVTRSLAVMRRTFADVRLGKAVRMGEVSGLVDDVVTMVERSPRTLLEVLRLKKKDEYTYLHSVAVCTLMVNMARHLGLADSEVRDYGLAGLLHDVGKSGVEDDVLNKPGSLTEDELQQVRGHPEHGYQLLAQVPNIPPMALDVCRHHHERADGKGYPFGLSEETLSLAARMGAICDVYDALTSDRSYKQAWMPADAVAAMWGWEGHFDRRMLFAFMQSIAVFPPHLMVQLRSNRLGIVLEPKRRNSLPRVLAFYSTREHRALVPEEVTISDDLANDSIVGFASPEEWGLAEAECTIENVRGAGWLERALKAAA